jgi:hypothetical protein
MQAELEQIISAIQSMDATELEQLLDVVNTRYAEVSSPSESLPAMPELGAEAPEDADPEYDAEMAGIPGIPPAAASEADMDVDEDEDFPPVPAR